ncbi:MAG: hypothetical protein LBQ42_09145 [Synergistaceae bacterium]|jgi:uncharacterized membrane protein YczE|nr:hypothetical protein [Synergistaceae bacterium]
MKRLSWRIAKLIFGLFLFSVGSYLSIQANIGLTPWSAFNMGVSGIGGISFGDVSVLASAVILVVDHLLNERLGIGTILDAVLIGKFTDLLLRADLMPLCDNFAAGMAVLLLGLLFMSVGSYFYISAGLGCGPRDLLMVALGKRLPQTSIGLIRGLIEGTALLTGWSLGAKIGIGTVVSVLGIGLILEYTFKLLRFDVRAIQHESVLASIKNVWRASESLVK